MALVLKTTDELIKNGVIKDVMTEDEKSILQTMVDILTHRLLSQKIEYVLAFGSLLAYARHDMRFPWDDDLDFMIDNSNMEPIFKDLKIVETGPWCKNSTGCKFFGEHNKKCCVNFKLSDDILITYKPWGMPIKITPLKRSFPGIDINTFTAQNGVIKVPEHELKNGHVNKFEVDVNKYYPFTTGRFMNSTVYLPSNIDGVLSYLWGEKWPTDCEVTYNHRQSRKFYDSDSMFPGNENVNANKYTRAKFSCLLLPRKFHGGVHFMGKNLNRSSTQNEDI